jgi:TetR/AcrR family transcriptional regulator, cholesterol catabolism regulator
MTLPPADSSILFTKKSIMSDKKISKEGDSVGKKKILNLARNLFWQNGYQGVSMRDLARAYGCQPANLYNHFKTKESILFEVLQEEMEKIIKPISHLADEEDGDPISQLRFIISSHLKITLSHRRTAKLLFDVALGHLSSADRKVIISMRDTYDSIIRRVIKRGQKKGIFSSHDEKLVGFMISSMITRTRIWFHPRKGVTIDELGDFIFQFALTGLLKVDVAATALAESVFWDQPESKRSKGPSPRVLSAGRDGAKTPVRPKTKMRSPVTRRNPASGGSD